jgi:hypothetical protein
VQPVPSLREAAEGLLDDPGGVIAFGEIHQTKATAGVRSALAHFIDDVLPVVGPRASHLIIETWIPPAGCDETEKRVDAEVARTTERPAATETEIVRLGRAAKALGVAPHLLAIGCEEYRALLGKGQGAGLDYDRLLTMTERHLEQAIRQALDLPRSAARPIVMVYGGALHNDLYPGAALAKYSFGPAVFALTGGAYREVDLYVPEMIDATPAVRAERWRLAWTRAGGGRQASVIRRSTHSAILVPARSSVP